MRLAGKTAVVTGGATIIGQAVVRALYADGAHVVIADIDDVGAKAVADELGPDVLARHTDITDDAEIAQCVAETVDRFGGVDILVNLACSYV
ncbi:MAG: SDR family NAD(P)-dependent oxidoreductase, partial [Haloechinothrix sp.]